jgi:mono/diheme cytochrome c family protein
MKSTWSIGALVTAAALVMLPLASQGAEDGAALYKTKCAMCHGANSEGKPAMKAPALKGTTKTAAQIAEHITKGEAESKPPHNKPVAGVNEAQAKAIADFVKTLK